MEDVQGIQYWKRPTLSKCRLFILKFPFPTSFNILTLRRAPMNLSGFRVQEMGMPQSTLTIYAPMIYTAPCVIVLMRADTLCGEVGGGGLELEIESFWSP